MAKNAKVVLIECDKGLFIGEEAGLFKNKLANPYRIYFDEEQNMNFEALGFNLAKVDSIKLYDVVFKAEVVEGIKNEYLNALEKDQTRLQ